MPIISIYSNKAFTTQHTILYCELMMLRQIYPYIGSMDFQQSKSYMIIHDIVHVFVFIVLINSTCLSLQASSGR